MNLFDWFGQLLVLIAKNIRSSGIRTFLWLTLGPAILFLITSNISEKLDRPFESKIKVGKKSILPHMRTNGVSFGYFPKTKDIEELMDEVREHCVEGDSVFVGYDNLEEVFGDDKLNVNVFLQFTKASAPRNKYEYVYSTYEAFPENYPRTGSSNGGIVSCLNSVIYHLEAKSRNVALEINTHDRFSGKSTLKSSSGLFVSIALFISTISYFASALLTLTGEKRDQMTMRLRQLGVSESAYWFSYFVSFNLFNVIGSALMTIAMIATKSQWTEKIGSANCFLFVSSSIAISISFGLYLSSIVKRPNLVNACLILTSLAYLISTLFLEFVLDEGTRLSMDNIIIRAMFLPMFVSSMFTGQISSDRDIQRQLNDVSNSTILGAVIGSFMYYLFAWYFSQVAGDTSFTSRKPLLFFLHFGKKKRTVQKGDTVSRLQQESLANQSVVLHKLSKAYGGVTAVKEFSTVLNPGQCYAILGPNGSGKTSLIKMLTGNSQPTHGHAFLMGMDVVQDVSQILSNIGVCQQEDLLWDNLSAYSHVRLFASLKKIPEARANMRQYVAETLRKVGLEKHMHKKVSAFSGGMKRRLSVVLSLIGAPKIVFLDEPTTGLDPINQRRIWNLISEYKKNRIILLTTHYMAEADELADIITIMHSGKVKASGNAHFLRKHYNVGYQLKVACKNEEKLAAIKQFIEQKIRTMEIVSSIGGILTLVVPVRQFSKLKQFLEFLDGFSSEKADPNPVDWNLSHSTLEQVFLRICSIQDGSVSEDNEMVRQKCQLCCQKQAEDVILYTKNGIEVFVPNVVCNDCAIGKSAEQVIDFKMEFPKAELKSDVRSAPSYVNVIQDEIKLNNSTGQQISSVYYKTAMFERRQRKLNCCYICCTLICLAIIFAMATVAHLVMNTAYGPKPKFYEASTTSAYSNGKQLSMESVQQVVKREFANCIRGPYQVNYTYGGYYKACIDGHLPSSSNYYTGDPIQERNSKKLEFRMSYVNNAEAEKILKEYFAEFHKFEIKFRTVYQFPLRSNGALYNSTYVAASSQVLSGVMLIFMVLISSLYVSKVSSLVGMEKSERLYFMMRLSGMSIASYWIGVVLFYFVLIGTMNFIVVLGGSLISWGKDPKASVGLVVLVTFLSVFSTISTGSLIGAASSSRSKAMKMSIAYFVLSCLLPSLFLIYPKISPQPLMFFAFICQFQLYQTAITKFGMLSFDNFYLPLTVLIIYIIVTFALSVFMMHVSTRRMNWNPFKKPVPKDLEKPTQSLHPDVVAEAKAVLNGERNGDAVVVKNLQKSYDGVNRVIDDLTFSIPFGECFGLLGPNGAGKTTLLSTLMRFETFDSGSAFINGVPITDSGIGSFLGICPQFDAVWGDLTVREHFTLYARLRGVPKAMINAHVQNIAELVQLDGDFFDTKASLLSGGTRRRLSIGISLIGFPKVVFLDEPTTGVDPQSRKQVWDVIEQIKKAKSQAVIITTHSMEEADSLCSRIGILANGNFQCLGTQSRLKSAFSSGVKISLTFDIQAEIGSNVSHWSDLSEAWLAQVEQTYTQKFIQFLESEASARNSLAKIQNVRTHGRVVQNQSFWSCHTEISMQDVDLHKLVAANSEFAKYHVSEWGISQSSLQDVFVKAVTPFLRED